MKVYPCPNPKVCDVTYHRDPSNCRALIETKASSAVPQIPPRCDVSPSDIGAESHAEVALMFDEVFPNGPCKERTKEDIAELEARGGYVVEHRIGNGKISSVEYFEADGTIPRDGMPYFVKYMGFKLDHAGTLRWADEDGEYEEILHHPGIPKFQQAVTDEGTYSRQFYLYGEEAHLTYEKFTDPDGYEISVGWSSAVPTYISERRWYKNGKPYREDDSLPDHISYNSDGAIFARTWWRERKDGGPTNIQYPTAYADRETHCWFYRGKSLDIPQGEFHRVSGPARVIIENGRVISEEWFYANKRPTEAKREMARRIAEREGIDLDIARGYVFSGWKARTIPALIKAGITPEEAESAVTVDGIGTDDELKAYIVAREAGMPHEWALTMAKGD